MMEDYAWKSGEYYCDGGCLDNGSVGARCYGSWCGPDGEIHTADFRNCHTNNEAEYQSLILLLEAMPRNLTVTIYMDSDLVRKQLSGEYKVKKVSLRPFHAKARKLLSQHPHVSIERVSGVEMKEVLGH